MKYIFLHGLGQKTSSWDNVISHIAMQDHILCPDLSLLCSKKETTYKNLYDAFSDYCNNISEPLSICGLSLGAVLALNFAIDNSQKVKSLILIAPQYEMPKKLLQFQNIIFRFMPKSAFKELGFRKNEFMKLTNSMIDLNFKHELNKISCPVLVACGEKDKANKKAAEVLTNNLLKAELQFVEKSNHEVNIDNPEKLAELINDFYHKQNFIL